MVFINTVEENEQEETVEDNNNTEIPGEAEQVGAFFGRSNDWNDEQREAYRILNAAYNQISILTYDHLLFRAKNVLGITEDVDTTDDDELPF